eukprot:jgi/Psemu1/256671/estExt_Genewise1Plus.C_1910029
MIDLGPVWSLGIFGKGVRVRVNDAGIDETNSAFRDRNNSNDEFYKRFNSNYDPHQHGTSVASIIGAAANNGECAVGVAPETTLSWCDGLQPDESFLEYRLDAMDVSQNSFEIDACTRSTRNKQCSYEGLSTTARRSISNGIRLGRNGLGIVYVFASGNAYYEGDDTNLKGYTTSRHTISVGAVGKDGIHTYYSTGGASLLLSAPAGDSEDLQKHIVAKVGGGCTSTNIGTSFASPVVSGVVALMLEINPELGWRDVQGILAQSATPVRQDPFDRTSVVNGAGLWHSNLYGFGIVNAHRAVELAKTWTNYGEEQVFAVDSGPLNYPIFDRSDPATPTTASLHIVPNTREETSFVVESVELLLDVVHISRGDLKIALTSPSGTESVLHPGKLPENGQLDTRDESQFWKLMTVRNREESPFGEWVLSITDEKAGQLEECVDMPDFVLHHDGVEVRKRFLRSSYYYCFSKSRSKMCHELFTHSLFVGVSVLVFLSNR